MSLDDGQLVFGDGERLILGAISEYEHAALVWLCIEKGLDAEITLKNGSKCPDHKMRIKTADFMIQLMKDCAEMRQGLAYAKANE